MSQHTTLPREDRPARAPVEHALTVLYSPDDAVCGQVRRLTRGGVVVGRDPEAPALRVDDPRMSRKHAAISWNSDRGAFVIEDLRSRNGIRVNGVDLDREVLAHGDVLRIGDSTFLHGPLEVGVANWQPDPESALQGGSIALERICQEIRRVASTGLSVLIVGATGSGKECVARQLHRCSDRSGPFVALNCAAVPENLVESELFGHVKGAFSGATEDRFGMFEQAEGGTFLLDEIGELSVSCQAKLLRVLEEKRVRRVGASEACEVDVRFLFATNRDLEQEIERDNFRADLLARIN